MFFAKHARMVLFYHYAHAVHAAVLRLPLARRSLRDVPVIILPRHYVRVAAVDCRCI